jgi:hypothetical protein
VSSIVVRGLCAAVDLEGEEGRFAGLEVWEDSETSDDSRLAGVSEPDAESDVAPEVVRVKKRTQRKVKMRMLKTMKDDLDLSRL